MSVITFITYGVDKRKAVKGRWRVSEARLLLLAFFGGAAGALLGMLAFHHKTRKWKFRITVPVFLVIQLFMAFFLWYCSDYYHAAPEANAGLVQDAQVTVKEYGKYWRFDGPSDEKAFIFYPGAKVEPESYAPLMHKLAAEGVDTYLVKMPFNLAFFGVDRAEKIMKKYDHTQWYIGGHSLGGVAAADYAAAHPGWLDGLILLASYPADQVSGDINGVLIYGTEDHVLNMEAVSKADALWEHSEYVIEGGNHAQFGDYGEQKGDGGALISRTQQQEETVQAVLEYMKLRQSGE